MVRPTRRGRAAWLVAALAIAGPASAEVRVVATSKPVYGLVAAVMGDVATPVLLVSGNASPHSYAMRPSDAAAAAGSDVLFRMSEALEPFTARLVKSLPAKVRVVSLQEAPGLTLHEPRDGGDFETGHEHHGHAAAGSKEVDPHVWLDPSNAAQIVDQVAGVLADADPANAVRYRDNAGAAKADIARLAAGIAGEFAPFAGRRFVVLHDAYQYFERRFGVAAAGAIAVTPEAAPSARRLAAIRKRIDGSGASCVLAEPGMQPKLVQAVVEGTSARVVAVDPEGTRLPASRMLYLDLMRALASGIRSCFERP